LAAKCPSRKSTSIETRFARGADDSGVIWLLILFSLTLGDYFTRDFLRPSSSHKVRPNGSMPRLELSP
jgi:hypothetical protein